MDKKIIKMIIILISILVFIMINNFLNSKISTIDIILLSIILVSIYFDKDWKYATLFLTILLHLIYTYYINRNKIRLITLIKYYSIKFILIIIYNVFYIYYKKKLLKNIYFNNIILFEYIVVTLIIYPNVSSIIKSNYLKILKSEIDITKIFMIYYNFLKLFIICDIYKKFINPILENYYNKNFKKNGYVNKNV